MDNTNRDIQIQLPRTLAIVKKIDDLPGLARYNGERSKPVKKKRQRNSYKHWIMPEQPEGYIKPKKNDFL